MDCSSPFLFSAYHYAIYHHPPSPSKVDANEFFCHPVPLGDNLYCKERPKVVPPPRAYGGEGGTAAGDGGAVLQSELGSSGRVRLRFEWAGS